MPSSVAARKARTAISPRLATSTFLIMRDTLRPWTRFGPIYGQNRRLNHARSPAADPAASGARPSGRRAVAAAVTPRPRRGRRRSTGVGCRRGRTDPAPDATPRRDHRGEGPDAVVVRPRHGARVPGAPHPDLGRRANAVLAACLVVSSVLFAVLEWAAGEVYESVQAGNGIALIDRPLLDWILTVRIRRWTPWSPSTRTPGAAPAAHPRGPRGHLPVLALAQLDAAGPGRPRRGRGAGRDGARQATGGPGAAAVGRVDPPCEAQRASPAATPSTPR